MMGLGRGSGKRHCNGRVSCIKLCGAHIANFPAATRLVMVVLVLVVTRFGEAGLRTVAAGAPKLCARPQPTNYDRTDAQCQVSSLSSSLANFRPALIALRLTGGAGKKRDAPSPRNPVKKHAGASDTALAGADAAEAEAEEKPDTSRNWDVQRVTLFCPTSSLCTCETLFRCNVNQAPV